MDKSFPLMRRLAFLSLSTGAFMVNAGCERAAETQSPNILFCIADDATWMHMGAYGCDWIKTPSFDRVAKNGILFNNAYTVNAKSAPSRASILTGRNSWQLEEAANHLCYFPAKFKTIAEALHEGGYQVGYTGKGWAPGDPGKIDGKPRELLVKAYNKMKTAPPTTGISPIDYASNFGEFLKERKKGKPFFFWYGGHEPHRKYEYGSGIKKGNKRPEQIDSVYSFWPDVDTVRTDLLDYAYEIEYFDQQLGKILDLLEETGELDNTLIVVTSDNGMPFPRIKGQNYEYSNHLPLAIMWKKGIKNPGRQVDDYISFIDFAATFAEVSGVDVYQYGMQPIEGESLTHIFQSKKSGQVDPSRNFVLLGKERHDAGRPHNQGYPIRAIIKDGMLYLRNFKPERWPAGNPETGYMNTDGSPTKSYILNLRRRGEDVNYWNLNFGLRPEEELYDLNTDPDCVHNLAKEEAYGTRKEQLARLMEQELIRQEDPRILGNGDVFDHYPPSVNVNLYERYMKGEKFNTGWINDSDFEKDTSFIRKNN